MAASTAAPLPRGCQCRPDPADLPVQLLSATVNDPTISPSLLALTVDYEARAWRAEALARHLLEWVIDFALRREERAHLAGRAMLDAVAPRGVPVPAHVIGDAGEVFGQLCAIPPDRIPPLPAGWPADGKTAGFARQLSAVTEGVYERFQPEFGGLYASLGIPPDPLAHVLDRWTTLHARPFRLLHTDLHRKNMILAHGRTYFLDWELALWGDPVYDLAVHLHKMGYSPSEYEAAQAAWLASVPPEAAQSWEPDLDTYLTHERVKSAIVDTVRYTKIITGGHASAHGEAELLRKLAGKLEAAQATGGNWPGRKPPGPEETLAIIRDWAHKRPG